MLSVRPSPRALAVAFGALLLSACSDLPTEPPAAGPSGPQFSASPQGVAAAIAAQERYTPALMRMQGVLGTAVGLNPAGHAVVQVFLLGPGVRGIPASLDGIPVEQRITGLLMALSDPRTRQRPAPTGYSVGHPLITAGTIGARVTDASGNVFVLSNNHVLANSNGATIGDATLQPGPYDGGTSADQIGTLYAFRPIDFSTGGANTMDAALAITTTANVGNATPADDGYGAPGGTIFGDANGDGRFDDIAALLNVNVQKYGRTSKLTKGRITGINASLSICYEIVFIFCTKSANFVDQVVVGTSGFSGGGDSGSLIVTDDAGRNPVGLLFAGSETETIMNRIDFVLSYFSVRVDVGEPPPPPTPVTDIAISSVTAPSSATTGSTVNVVVTVANVGNQNVDAAFDVTLADATAGLAVGTQSVASLAAGATTTLTFAWNTTGSSAGSHTLTASHNRADDVAGNDSRSTAVTLFEPSTAIHIGDLDGIPSNDGNTWSATVEVTVHDGNHNPINGAYVRGTWTPTSALTANECTTGDLGGNGTCIMLYPSLRNRTRFVTFTVDLVSMLGQTYDAAQNHDADGDSNGTTIRVNKP